MIVEDLIEPPATRVIPPYLDERRRWWAQRWPFECIWKVRRHGYVSARDSARGPKMSCTDPSSDSRRTATS